MRELIADIKRVHRDFCYYEDTRKSIDLRLGAHIRTALGWSLGKPQKERKAIEREANQIIAGKVSSSAFERIVARTAVAREPFEIEEDVCKKELSRLAQMLPVWKSFGESVRGFSPLGLGIIVAEAGDLSNYATEAKLWKRMGVAVMDGVRQGKVPENLTGKARKEAWMERGYSPVRRARLFARIGDPLLKGNKGAYRAAYDHRRAHTQITHPEWWRDKDGNAKLNKDGSPASDHGHKDAQRYMEKRLLRDLWRAWRKTNASIISQESKANRKLTLRDGPSVQSGTSL